MFLHMCLNKVNKYILIGNWSHLQAIYAYWCEY